MPGEQLIPILTQLDKRYPRVAAFIRAVHDTATRYLAGDTSMSEELHDIRAAQEELPHDHPARAFAGPIESGALGNLNPATSTPKKPAAVEWFFVRQDTKDATKEKNAALKNAIPNAKPCDFAQVNRAIGKLSTGFFPADFKRKWGIQAYKATRDYMTGEQLAIVYNAEKAATRMLSAPDGKFHEKFNKYSNLIFEANQISGLYDKAMPDGPPKLSLEETAVLEKAKARRVEAVPQQKAIEAAKEVASEEPPTDRARQTTIEESKTAPEEVQSEEPPAKRARQTTINQYFIQQATINNA